jgi:rhodanese-related sulfurtransferase
LTTDLSDLKKENLDRYTFMDIREPDEVFLEPCKEIKCIEYPLSEDPAANFPFDKDKHYVIFCAMGGRSLMLTEELHSQGITNTVSLNGGIRAIKGLFRDG